MSNIIENILKEAPKFHGVTPTTWNSNVNLLQYIDKHCLKPDLKTLEIGSGYSTIVFLANQCFHTTVTVFENEVIRLKEYCNNNNISTEKHNIIIGDSTEKIPALNSKYDVIFIDGAHRFPYPIVDWYYCTNLLNNKGLIIIDDIDITSCNILVTFMSSDPHWKEIIIKENYAIFEKMSDPFYPEDWKSQPFSLQNDYKFIKQCKTNLFKFIFKNKI